MENLVEINDIPDDVMFRIFKFLPVLTRVRIETVCQRWCRLLSLCWTNVEHVSVMRNEVRVVGVTDSYLYKVIVDAALMRGLLRKAGRHIRILKIRESSCVDLEVLQDIASYCTNIDTLSIRRVKLPEEKLDNVTETVEALMGLPKLRTLIWDRVLSNIERDRRPEPFPPLDHADSLAALQGLRQLHLENASLVWGNFVMACMKLAPTLEEFCYKTWDQYLIPLRCTLNRGLQELKRVKQFNIGTDHNIIRPLGGMLDDDFVCQLVEWMPLLQRLSIRAASNVTVRGISALLRSLPDLEYLNLNQCETITNSVLEVAAQQRDRNSKTLTIYCAETEVDATKLHLSGYNLIIVDDARFTDESVFFGESD